MKICAAQFQPAKGDIQQTILVHENLIEKAIHQSADLICFPELSLTGYEPELAQDLAIERNDRRLENFQILSDKNDITICLGIPLRIQNGVRISMIIFQPLIERLIYSKRFLHDDELPYFIAGSEEKYFQLGNQTIAPAICYESLLPLHAAQASVSGASVYLASVAKSKTGIEKAFHHYPEIARQFSLPVIMSNSIGYSDNFLSFGNSGAWTSAGELIARLDDKQTGFIIFDTKTQTAEAISLVS